MRAIAVWESVLLLAIGCVASATAADPAPVDVPDAALAEDCFAVMQFDVDQPDLKGLRQRPRAGSARQTRPRHPICPQIRDCARQAAGLRRDKCGRCTGARPRRGVPAAGQRRKAGRGQNGRLRVCARTEPASFCLGDRICRTRTVANGQAADAAAAGQGGRRPTEEENACGARDVGEIPGHGLYAPRLASMEMLPREIPGGQGGLAARGPGIRGRCPQDRVVRTAGPARRQTSATVDGRNVRREVSHRADRRP